MSMDRSKIIATIFAIAFFGLGLFLASRYELNPIIDKIIIVVGLFFLLMSIFCFYKSKRIFLFIITGLLLMMASYGIFFFFGKSHIEMVYIVFLIVFLVALVVYNIGLFKMTKEFFNK